MTRPFLLKEHIRVALFDGVGDGIDNGRTTAIVFISDHLDVGAFFFRRKDGFVGVCGGGGNSPQVGFAGVVSVLGQPHKIFVQTEGNEGIGGQGGGEEQEAQDTSSGGLARHLAVDLGFAFDR